MVLQLLDRSTRALINSNAAPNPKSPSAEPIWAIRRSSLQLVETAPRLSVWTSPRVAHPGVPADWTPL